MQLNKFKTAVILVFFCILLQFIQGGSNYLRAEENSATELSVSVASNPINRLVQKIRETRDILEQKKREFEERNKIDINAFLIFIGAGGLIGTGIFLLDSYFKYKKRKKRREKRKKARKRSASRRTASRRTASRRKRRKKKH